MRIPIDKAVQALHCLVEGCSIRSTQSLTGLEKKTVLALLTLVAVHFAHRNFCRIHGSLRVTPAMEAGITDHVWTMEERIKDLDRPLWENIQGFL